jgi:hypothetical protein
MIEAQRGALVPGYADPDRVHEGIRGKRQSCGLMAPPHGAYIDADRGRNGL